MSLSFLNQIQFIAWFLALSEFILAFYALSFTIRPKAVRHLGALMMLIAVNSISLGLLPDVTEGGQPGWPVYLLTGTSFAIQPLFWLVTVALFLPNWLRERREQIQWPVYGLIILPVALLLVDFTLGTGLWYQNLAPGAFLDGFAFQARWATGGLAPLFVGLSVVGLPLVIVATLLYVALWAPAISPHDRRLAWALLGGYAAAAIVELGAGGRFGSFPALIAGAGLALICLYAAFSVQRTAEGGRKSSLQLRLTTLVLVITVPILVAVTTLVGNQAAELLVQHSDKQLEVTNRALADNTSTWLQLNVDALYYLVSLPDIVSMNAARQKPVLERMAAAYPHLFLVNTTDLNGFNVARNDDQENKDYSDRAWYRGARYGAPVSLEVLVSRTTGHPALNMAAPIRDETGNIIGVGSIVSELDDISQQVAASRVGETGFGYLIDNSNRVVAHPDPSYSAELRDLTSYPPVVALRQGKQGWISFTDEQGEDWRAYVDRLGNGWGVIVQEPEAQAFTALREFQQISWIVLNVGIVLLLVLVWLGIRRASRPIKTLTAVVTAVAAGDINRTAPVETTDELGTLAIAINSMTEQLRQLIGELEHRVVVRTQRLEVVASLGERLNAILDQEELLAEVIYQIRANFDYYHAQIYLLDSKGEKLITAAGSGEAGEEMKLHGYSIPVSAPTSPAARAVRSGQIVRMDDLREIGDWQPHPLLPEAHSEMAVPILVEGQVVGVLAVQADKVAGLDESDSNLLRALANQIAVAINNARLFQETQTALSEVEALNRQLTREAWRDIRDQVDTNGYIFTRSGTVMAADEWLPAMALAVQQKNLAHGNGHDHGVEDKMNSLAVPLVLRGEVIGVIGIERPAAAGEDPDEGWSEDELITLQSVTGQIALALDAARLARETERSAWRDRVVSETTARVWSSSEIEEVMKAAVAQLGEKLHASEVIIRLGTEVKPV